MQSEKVKSAGYRRAMQSRNASSSIQSSVSLLNCITPTGGFPTSTAGYRYLQQNHSGANLFVLEYSGLSKSGGDTTDSNTGDGSPSGRKYNPVYGAVMYAGLAHVQPAADGLQKYAMHGHSVFGKFYLHRS